MIVTSTFLFSDIEGSTRLWENYPEKMRVVLARHDALMRAAIAEHGGTVFKTVGDAFCAAFPDAAKALLSALDAQTALQTEKWPEETPIRVRMALNTGAAEVRNYDYFGPPLNRVARLMSVAYGNQVLVSSSTAELASESLPPGLELKDLGEHRLRDLHRAETIFQLVHPSLHDVFPALKTIESYPNNLPQQLATFVGREVEVIELRELLDTTRMVTLVGSGGSGKTRLALHVAAEALDHYIDGAWLVELAGLRDGHEVMPAVADALCIRETAGLSREAELFEYLKGRRLLVILDNCEHLLDACAKLVDRILRQVPGVTVLATSRSPLGIVGETTFRIPSLKTPAPRERYSMDELLHCESVRLFLDRASAVSPNFVLGDSNSSAVAELVRRLDGIPLAIELAASRVRVLDVDGILERLTDRFRLLTGGSRTALPRHQTLRALIDWSYDLLDDEQKAAFRRLAVFNNGFRLEEAESVAASEEPRVESWQILDILTALVDRSLVVFDDGRYRLLESVREYAFEKLFELGEAESAVQRHAATYRDLAETAEPHLSSETAGRWMDRLDGERDNLRASLEHFLVHPDGAQSALRMTGALLWFWDVRGHWREGSEWLARALSAHGDAPPNAEVSKALRAAGLLAISSGNFSRAEEIFRRNVDVARQIGDRLQEARATHNLALAMMRKGLGLDTLPLFEESLRLFRELGEKLGQARALSNMALVLNDGGQWERAADLYRESLEVAKALGDDRGIAIALNNIGAIHAANREFQAARERYTESLEVRQRLGEPQGISTSLHNLGLIALHEGLAAEARGLLTESLRIRKELQDAEGLVESMEALAYLSCVDGNYPLSAQLFGLTERARIDQHKPMHGADVKDHRAYRARVFEALGEYFEALVAEGGAMDWAETVDRAPEFTPAPNSFSVV